MILLKVLKRIVDHPLNKKRKLNAIKRFVKWQINTILNPYPVIYPYAEKSKFIIWKGLTGATGNLYCGLLEFEDMSFLLHFLRRSDTFVDIGANVGSYTILGANEVGAHTISIEPIPRTFEILEENIVINKVQNKVKSLNIGLGSKKGQLKFTKSNDTTNHVATKNNQDLIDVPVDLFDNIIELKNPTLIKIDVEGFETEVLNGMSNALINDNLRAIIIELNGSGKRYGYDERKIHNKLLSHQFIPYRYFPFERKLNKLENYGTHNTIYIRDIEFVRNRIITAKRFKILEQEF